MKASEGQNDQAAYNKFFTDMKNGFATLSQIYAAKEILGVGSHEAEQVLLSNPDSFTNEQLDQIMRVSP